MCQDSSHERVLDDLVTASRIFVAVASESLAGDDEQLSIQQYRALGLVASQESQRPIDLARALGVAPSTTTALCDRLVQKGLLVRRRRGTDRRSVSLTVSTRGREELDKVAARRRRRLRQVLDQLPPTTQAQLAGTLRDFITAANHVDINEWSIRGL